MLPGIKIPSGIILARSFRNTFLSSRSAQIKRTSHIALPPGTPLALYVTKAPNRARQIELTMQNRELACKSGKEQYHATRQTPQAAPDRPSARDHH